MYSAQKYVKWYEELDKKGDANQNLLELQQSEQAWSIAKQLMTDKKYHIHGCQLLSKKLNKPVALPDSELLQMEKFIFSFDKTNPTIFYIAAKIHLHLCRHSISYPVPLLINVLSHLPEAMISIRVIHSIHLPDLVKETFKHHLPTLIAYFSTYTQDIIRCIDSMVANSIKLNSKEMMELLLTRPIGEVGPILQEILLTEKYPQLNGNIFAYLNNVDLQEHLKGFFPLYVAFCRSLTLLDLQSQLLISILQKIVSIMRIDLQSNTNGYITDTFQLWAQISQQTSSKPSTQQAKLCYQAFVEVWKIAIQKSILSEIPDKIQTYQPVLALSVDDEDEGEMVELSANPSPGQKFRNTAQDFLMITFKTFQQEPNYLKEIFFFIYGLAESKQPLKVEVAVFVMLAIIDFVEQSQTQFAAQVVKALCANQISRKHIYIWKQILKLIGQLGIVYKSHGSLLEVGLNIISFSLKVPELESLASDVFNNLLGAFNEPEIKNIQQNQIEQFLNSIYEPDYLQGKNKRSFFNLTKAILTFIYKFKINQTYFQNYLKSFSAKLQKLNNSEKCEYLENLASCHLTIQHQYSSHFTFLLSPFFLTYQNNLLEEIMKSNDKKTLNTSLLSLKFIVAAVGGHQSLIWGQILLKVFSILENKEQSISSAVALSVKLLEVKDIDPVYFKDMLPFLKQTQPRLSNILLSLNSKQYTQIKNILMFNLQILQRRFYDYLYEPQKIFSFICSQILREKDFWEYETIRVALAILLNLVQNQYQIQIILFEVLTVYPRYQETFYKSLEGILIEVYRKRKINIFFSCFEKIKPELLPPNPLWDALHKALQNSEGKSIRNILLCLE